MFGSLNLPEGHTHKGSITPSGFNEKRWRTSKDPYQRHCSPRLCDSSYFKNPDRIENIKAQTEAAIAAGELLHEVAMKRRFKSKKAWGDSP